MGGLPILADIDSGNGLVDLIDRFHTVHPVLFSWLVGCISGLLLSIPIGPVNLIVMNEGARRGFKTAIIMSAGATLMEMTYCFIAFSGFASLLQGQTIKAVMELVSFVFMLWLGLKFLRANSINAPVELGETAHRIEERIETKLHPHSAFWIGFVRVMSNPGVLAFWIVLATNFISRDWVRAEWSDKLACVSGVGCGTGLWFLVLSYGTSRGHGRFSDKTLLRMGHFSGVGLLALAFIHGCRIVWQMVQHHRMIHPH